jgi:hypothetical protein
MRAVEQVLRKNMCQVELLPQCKFIIVENPVLVSQPFPFIVVDSPVLHLPDKRIAMQTPEYPLWKQN